MYYCIVPNKETIINQGIPVFLEFLWYLNSVNLIFIPLILLEYLYITRITIDNNALHLKFTKN